MRGILRLQQRLIWRDSESAFQFVEDSHEKMPFVYSAAKAGMTDTII